MKDRTAFLGLIMGVTAIPMTLSIIPGVILGIVAIACGTISRIHAERFHPQNALAIVFGIIAIFLSAVMFLAVVMIMSNPESMAMMTEFMETYYAQ